MTRSNHRLVLGLCLALAVGTLICFWPVTRHEFVNLDDQQYIVENAHVTEGLSWAGARWAFGTGYACNWHPLTWLSHMADCSLYGLNPRGHHLTNLLFHSANVLLLFLVLIRTTRALWCGFLVAALFAWHPLHVESVAWAAERKDVLSTFFWLLTLLAYSRYVELAAKSNGGSGNETQPPGRRAKQIWLWYGFTLVLFTLGLMSKPMVVTLPFVLLLLDYWPLSRQSVGWGRLVLEKAPFFALSFAACFVTYLVQHNGGAVSTLHIIPLHLRLENAVVVYLRYISKFFWPADLAVIYPYPKALPVAWWLGAVIIVAAWSGLFLAWRKSRPYLAVGWFWFLGTLVPTIGLVQVGSQAMADRYTYIPGIGLSLLVVWGLSGILETRPVRRWIPAASAGVLVAACLICTGRQLTYWQDGESLFRHAIRVMPDNSIAYDGLGSALGRLGRKEEALTSALAGLRLEPGYPMGQYNVGALLLEQNRLNEAAAHFRLALTLSPNFPEAQLGLGTALLKSGDVAAAEPFLVGVVSVRPEDIGAHYNLGMLRLSQSRFAEAVAELSEVVRLKPGDVEAHRSLAVALIQQGRPKEAIVQFTEVVRLAPIDPESRFNLGLALSGNGQYEEAATQFAEGLRLRPEDTKTHYRLAVVLARMQKPSEAINHYREALRLTPEFPEARAELASLLATSGDSQTLDRPEASSIR